MITAIATGVIGYFTYTLKQSTDKLWKAGEEQIRHAEREAFSARFNRIREEVRLNEQINIARQSAEAAKQAADAAVATERARFYVVIDQNFEDRINAVNTWDGKIPDEQRLAASNWPMAKIVFKNYGKTPGIVIEVGTGIEYWEKVSDPVYDVKVVNENIIASGDSTENFPTIINGAISLGKAKKVKSGEANIWIFGYVSYDDVFCQRQTHRFFQRFVAISDGFRYVLQSYDDKHYNSST